MKRTQRISENKLRIEIAESPWKKKEVKVTLINGSKSFYPSFTDLYRIAYAICNKEDERYPTGKGRKLLGEFLKDACSSDYSFEQLVYKYNLPITNENNERIKTWDVIGREECIRRSYSNNTQPPLFYLDTDFEEALKGVKE